MLTENPISCAAYARSRGLTPAAVSLAIKHGRLVESVVRDHRGQPKIGDPDLADQEWRANTNAEMRVRAAGGEPRAYKEAGRRLSAAEATETSAPLSPAPPMERVQDLASAAARAKHWEASLKELKFREAAKELIPARDVEARLVAVFSACKIRLLEVPTRAKQALPHLQVTDLEVLDRVVREALEALTT